jgi:hypothetical protein
MLFLSNLRHTSLAVTAETRSRALSSRWHRRTAAAGAHVPRARDAAAAGATRSRGAGAPSPVGGGGIVQRHQRPTHAPSPRQAPRTIIYDLAPHSPPARNDERVNCHGGGDACTICDSCSCSRPLSDRVCVRARASRGHVIACSGSARCDVTVGEILKSSLEDTPRTPYTRVCRGRAFRGK